MNHRIAWRSLLALLLVGSSLFAFAQESHPGLSAEVAESNDREGVQLVSLAQAVDIALKNNPATRAAWFRARAARDVVGIKEATFLPSVDLFFSANRQQQVAQGGNVVTLLSSLGPAAALNWVLFDFGSRRADVNEAAAFAAAASLASDAIVQAVILRVEEAWIQYNAARELVAAAEVNLKEARTSLEAAQARKSAGVATIADVLQAKTALSRAQLNLEQATGFVSVLRGSLATSLGVPATTPVEAAPLSGDEGSEFRKEAGDITALVEKALQDRPDLVRSEELRRAAEQRVASAKGLALPVLATTAVAGRSYYLNSGTAPYGDTWSVGLNVRFPVFTGFARTHEIARAKEEAEAARQDTEGVKQQVILDVWTSLQNLKTSERQLVASRDLLESALQSMEAATARYKAGVGTIIDLLTAESALASARASLVDARASKLLATARLAHATGFLLIPAPSIQPAPLSR
jgi:TolC family type I secretion outer membrane protein